MTRAIALCLILSGCIDKGYVVRSVSVGARPGAVNLTVTFDNVNLPETQGCIEFCAVE
jgi:hypothetical protein